jgi:endoglucanase
MTWTALLTLTLAGGIETGCTPPVWQPLWNSYTARFMDGQIRVIDRDENDRTTSEAQAYGMFFALVANDRPRFDGLLRWTEHNLASGDLKQHLPAWLWGRDPKTNQWGVLDANSASDADVWMAYSLLEAGRLWDDRQLSAIGTAMIDRIEKEEVVALAGTGPVLLPAPTGFQHEDRVRLNVSYMPLQLLTRLANLRPDGPWARIAELLPQLISRSAPRGFPADWVEFTASEGFTASAVGSFDAIRVYLWAGLLDPETPQRNAILSSVSGMSHLLRANAIPPPAQIGRDGSVVDGRSPIGYSAALVPYFSATGETKLERAQMERVHKSLDQKTGLYGNPGRYYDQNLILFAIGSVENEFRFDANGSLQTRWNSH